MNVIRPVRKEDLESVMKLAGKSGFGLTSLPKDPELMEQRIEESLQSFNTTANRPRGELYVFVMEDTSHGEIVGTSCIVSKVGGFEPFYAYRVRTVVHESQSLGIRKEVRILELVQEHSGPCEIGGLFLAPEFRRHGNGRLLSLFRFLFMDEHKRRFEPTIIAEMRGVVDEEGRSPFWEALGHHFFDMEFPKADYLSLKDKSFIADLMPRCPIYIDLLPSSAQEVIGRVHHQTEPALKMLQGEGFRFSGLVDIFEAGPVITAQLDSIRIVGECVTAEVAEIRETPPDSTLYIVASNRIDFRACIGQIDLDRDRGATLSSAAAKILDVEPGDRIRFSPLRPSFQREETRHAK